MSKEFSILINKKPLTEVISKYHEIDKKNKIESIKTEICKEYLKYDRKNALILIEDIKKEFPEYKIELIEYRELLIKEILNIIYKKKNSIYDKTESTLYSKEAIEEIIMAYKDEINKLKKSNKEIPTFSGKSKKMIIDGVEHTYIYADDSLKNRISLLMQQVAILESHLRLLNYALKKIENDPYYNLIEEIFFKRTSYNEISTKFNWKYGTISKHRRELVSKISVILFAEEYYVS